MLVGAPGHDQNVANNSNISSAGAAWFDQPYQGGAGEVTAAATFFWEQTPTLATLTMFSFPINVYEVWFSFVAAGENDNMIAHALGQGVDLTISLHDCQFQPIGGGAADNYDHSYAASPGALTGPERYWANDLLLANPLTPVALIPGNQYYYRVSFDATEPGSVVPDPSMEFGTWVRQFRTLQLHMGGSGLSPTNPALLYSEDDYLVVQNGQAYPGMASDFTIGDTWWIDDQVNPTPLNLNSPFMVPSGNQRATSWGTNFCGGVSDGNPWDAKFNEITSSDFCTLLNPGLPHRVWVEHSILLIVMGGSVAFQVVCSK